MPVVSLAPDMLSQKRQTATTQQNNNLTPLLANSQDTSMLMDKRTRPFNNSTAGMLELHLPLWLLKFGNGYLS